MQLVRAVSRGCYGQKMGLENEDEVGRQKASASRSGKGSHIAFQGGENPRMGRIRWGNPMSSMGLERALSGKILR